MTLLVSLSLGVAPVRALDDASSSCNAFSFALLQQAGKTENNTVFSPFSIWSTLAMTSAGAEAETLQQMQQALFLPSKNSHDVAGGWSKSLKNIASVGMKVANHLWGKQGLTFQPAFLKIIEQQYGAGLVTLDFPGDPDGSRRHINQWVADNTEGKITDLVGPGLINPDTRLVLTNAVYFKGRWARPFNASNTRKESFTLATGKAVKPEMMSKLVTASYMENYRLQAIKLPYQNGDMAMIVVLPRKTEQLNDPAFLTSDGFANVLAEMNVEERVDIKLPKFEAAAKVLLADNIKAMGMVRAFTGYAQFGLMSDSPLFISEIVHQAWIKVAEEGTEAAAATASVMALGAMPMNKVEPKLFIADHPFLFFVIDDRNGGIVFAGRMMDPTR